MEDRKKFDKAFKERILEKILVGEATCSLLLYSQRLGKICIPETQKTHSRSRDFSKLYDSIALG